MSYDLSKELRNYANNNGYSHGDYADTMRQAADRIAELEARTPAATADTELSEYNTGDTDLNALLCLTDDMARFGGNQDSGEARMMSLRAVIAKLTPAAPVVAEGLTDKVQALSIELPGPHGSLSQRDTYRQGARDMRQAVVELLATHPVAGSPALAEPKRTTPTLSRFADDDGDSAAQWNSLNNSGNP